MDTKFVNHGLKELQEQSAWQINNGEIILTIGKILKSGEEIKMDRITLQVNGKSGPLVETRENMKSGMFLEVKTNERIVVYTVVRVDFDPAMALIGLTENVIDQASV